MDLCHILFHRLSFIRRCNALWLARMVSREAFAIVSECWDLQARIARTGATGWRPPGWLLVGLSIRKGTWPRYQTTYPVEGRTTAFSTLSLDFSFEIHPVSHRRISRKLREPSLYSYFPRRPFNENVLLSSSINSF